MEDMPKLYLKVPYIIYTGNELIVIIVPADGLPDNGARPSTGTALTAKFDTILSKLHWVWTILNECISADRSSTWPTRSREIPRHFEF